jgi:uncharacterized protein
LRLSGGEPFLAFQNYKDIVLEFQKKSEGKIKFGVLTNLTILTDEIIEWLQKTNIGVQVSLDDLENQKPFHDGTSSASVVLKNIEKLREARISHSPNCVIDLDRATDVTKIADYINEHGNNISLGLNVPYELDDEERIDGYIEVFMKTIAKLKENNYDIVQKLRLCNTSFDGTPTCGAGAHLFAIGTNLEVWSCQSLIDKAPLGYFSDSPYAN